jgi:hypothetical protein
MLDTGVHAWQPKNHQHLLGILDQLKHVRPFIVFSATALCCAFGIFLLYFGCHDLRTTRCKGALLHCVCILDSHR